MLDNEIVGDFLGEFIKKKFIIAPPRCNELDKVPDFLPGLKLRNYSLPY